MEIRAYERERDLEAIQRIWYEIGWIDSEAEAVIRRRFAAGWHNFNCMYRQLVDAWALYDNSEAIPKFIAQEVKE